MVVPNALEGKGLVTGRVQGTRVQMSVRAVLVTVGTPAQFESGIDLTGIRNSNRIIGEITFEGGEAEYVDEATGRRVGVHMDGFQATSTPGRSAGLGMAHLSPLDFSTLREESTELISKKTLQRRHPDAHPRWQASHLSDG